MLGYPDPHPASQPHIPIPQVLAAPSTHQFALGDGQVSQHGIHNAVGHSSCDGQLDFTGSRKRALRASTHQPCKPWGHIPRDSLAEEVGAWLWHPEGHLGHAHVLWLAGSALPEQEWE